MKATSTAPRIVQLADRLADDIRERKLRPGDPYLSTAEAARFLAVSGTTANQALQLLAQRNVIERRQRKGAFVSDPEEAAKSATIDRVHLLVHRNYLKTEGVLADGVVIGLQGELPQAEMQFNFMPPAKEAEYVSELTHEALRAQQREGFVLVRATLDAQRLVSDSGLPAVVHGLLHPSIERLPSIDRDHSQIGRLLVDHLVEQGAERIALFFRERVTAGEHVLFDAVRDQMIAHGLGLDALELRCLPADEEAVRCAAAELLAKDGGRLGFLCRSEPLAAGVSLAAGKRRGRKHPIVFCDVYRAENREPAFPHTVSTLSPQETGRAIGRLLVQQARGEMPKPPHTVIPVTLKIPG